MSLPGVVGAVFFSCWQEPGFQQGMWLGEGSEVSSAKLLLQLLAAGRGGETWPLQEDPIHGELFRAVFGKGKPRRGKECLSEEEAACQGVHVQTQLCFHLISQQKRSGNGQGLVQTSGLQLGEDGGSLERKNIP